jgi:surface antigen
VAFVPDFVFGLPPYSGCRPLSLCRALRRLAPTAAIVALALSASGCSYQLGSMFDKGKDQPQAVADTTGTVPDTTIVTKPAAVSDRDLAYARAAATEVLRRGGKGTSLPWENPETGARGTVTPIATAYDSDGFTCQDFLASYVHAGKSEDWMRGEACRVHKGNWEVRSLKPWKTS